MILRRRFSTERKNSRLKSITNIYVKTYLAIFLFTENGVSKKRIRSKLPVIEIVLEDLGSKFYN